jgi:hypothetical protein
VDGDAQLEIEAGVTFDKEDQAKRAEQMARQGMNQASLVLGDIARAFTISQKGSDLVVSGHLTEAQIQQLLQQLSAALGLMNGEPPPPPARRKK